MIASGIINLVKMALRLRYKIELKEETFIKPPASNESGLLILPNHPALIDPVIIFSHLYKKFNPNILVDENQLEKPGMKTAAKIFNFILIPDFKIKDETSGKKFDVVLQEVVAGLKEGKNIVIYPAGRIYRSKKEDLGANSMVYHVLESLPSTRLVLVRTVGLWGSSFGRGLTGNHPTVDGSRILKTIWKLLVNFIFFVPKRKIKITLAEQAESPYKNGPVKGNEFLENFYNQNLANNLKVSSYWWQFPYQKILPEPQTEKKRDTSIDISEDIANKVIDYLQTETGISNITLDHLLASDLALDSLGRADIGSWVEAEFNVQINPEGVETVRDLCLAASGILVDHSEVEISSPKEKWWTQDKNNNSKVCLASGKTITEVFLNQARLNPGRITIADEKSGVKTYRDLIIAITILKPFIEEFSDEKIGVMLPASVGATLCYLSVLYAGKTPTMINWTVGLRNMQHSLSNTGVSKVLTAKALTSKLKSQGIKLPEENLVYLEDFRPKITVFKKIRALALGYFSWSHLEKISPPSTSAILFTSGSEGLPKTVPLNHRNQIENIQGILKIVDLYQNDRLLGMLPPFHSFGLAINILLPVLGGLPVVYYPNPTEGHKIAQYIKAYKTSLIAGTPTFLQGILHNAEKDELLNLKIAVTGAEKCGDQVVHLANVKCPNLKILEGYGITECSPVLSVNPSKKIKMGTMGTILPNIEKLIIHPETEKILEPGEAGVLLVRGPSIFEGYHNYDGLSPFKKVLEKDWYVTGDLVCEDQDGYITFKGRLKRFIKMGGEMVSLPAIEEVLNNEMLTSQESTPILAIDVSENGEKQDIILYSIKDISREEVNQIIAKGGLSPIHNVRKVIKIEEIPLLGTGKINYRDLKNIKSND